MNRNRVTKVCIKNEADAKRVSAREKRNEQQRKYYAKNKDKWKKYRLDNFEKYKERERLNDKKRAGRKRIDNRKGRKDTRRNRNRADKQLEVIFMKRHYIIKLMRDAGYNVESVTTEQIETYKALLLFKREIKKHDEK